MLPLLDQVALGRGSIRAYLWCFVIALVLTAIVKGALHAFDLLRHFRDNTRRLRCFESPPRRSWLMGHLGMPLSTIPQPDPDYGYLLGWRGEETVRKWICDSNWGSHDLTDEKNMLEGLNGLLLFLSPMVLTRQSPRNQHGNMEIKCWKP
eukprot:g35037.t1